MSQRTGYIEVGAYNGTELLATGEKLDMSFIILICFVCADERF